MRITYKGDYALKTILGLALDYGNSPVTIPDLARRADIPIKFLEQILLDLKRGGFV
jgi:DNA-binding IscR family transcriptional regulator